MTIRKKKPKSSPVKSVGTGFHRVKQEGTAVREGARRKLSCSGTEPTGELGMAKRQGEDTGRAEPKLSDSGSAVFVWQRWTRRSPEKNRLKHKKAGVAARCLIAMSPSALASQTQEGQGNDTSRGQLWLRSSPNSTAGRDVPKKRSAVGVLRN